MEFHRSDVVAVAVDQQIASADLRDRQIAEEVGASSRRDDLRSVENHIWNPCSAIKKTGGKCSPIKIHIPRRAGTNRHVEVRANRVTSSERVSRGAATITPHGEVAVVGIDGSTSLVEHACCGSTLTNHQTLTKCKGFKKPAA